MKRIAWRLQSESHPKAAFVETACTAHPLAASQVSAAASNSGQLTKKVSIMATCKFASTFVPRLAGIALTASLAALSSTAQAAIEVVLTYNTGVDSNQIVLPDGTPDPHYQLISVPSGPLTAPVAKTLGFPLSPFGGWAATNSTSAWITPTAPVGDPPPPIDRQTTNASGNGNGPPGNYLYRTTFDLSGYSLTSPISLSGIWAADNSGLSVRLNPQNDLLNQGDLIAAGYGSYTAVPTFGYTDANFLVQTFFAGTGFVPGINTLEFLIHNSDAQTGLRVEYFVEAVPVPEPSAWALMALGLAGITFLKTRRRNA